MGELERLRGLLDPSVPSPARMYDYYLGGKDNGYADREAAEDVLAEAPEVRMVARDNRRFLVSVVRDLAARGVDQFIDLGAGIPTAPNVHEVAREMRPAARVVYVDNDPVVLAHTRALRADGHGEVVAVEGDVRCPGDIIADPDLRRTLDLSRPVAVLMLAVLHFVPDADDPASIARVLHAGLAPGSYLAISHATADDDSRAAADAAAAVYAKRGASAPAIVRDAAQIRALVEPWSLDRTGLVPTGSWPAPASVEGITLVGGLARHS